MKIRLLFLALAIGIGLVGLVSAQEDDPVEEISPGRFEVRSAYTELQDGVYFLNAKLDYELSDAAKEALHNGLSLTMEMQIEVLRPRRFWFDREVFTLNQRHELTFQALSERYTVKNLNSGDLTSFSTLESATETLGTVRHLPFLDEALLRPDKRYDVRLRGVLDTRELAGPLRLLTFFWDQWRLTSDWYTWPLRI
ncbi:MAG: DUF4390 domain-containing protein [Pseudomonadota bacterium]